MASPNLLDALRLSESIKMKKTKVLRGNTAKSVLLKVSKKDEKKNRSAGETRKAMYGKDK